MLDGKAIPAMKACDVGHQFVVYGDSCSGIAGAENERNLRQVNAAIQKLDASPDFICFLGDEIMGLSRDRAELRRQWRHFFGVEMAWLDRSAAPLYHTTGNHTAFDQASEAVYREVMAHLPQNGQRGLSYWARHGDLLLIFVNTLDRQSGGEGAVETDWLERVFSQHDDATYKLVFGHHPVWAVNGYFGDYQRQIECENGRRFWEILRRHGALAYFCSHILAYDAQVHGGLLQICTAGAGTAHRMPEGEEYLHFLQVALDEAGLRYQSIDRQGEMREWLAWEWRLPPASSWRRFEPACAKALPRDCLTDRQKARLIVWEIGMRLPAGDDRPPRMLLSAEAPGGALPYFWLGISGVDRRLTALLSPAPNRSPHRWLGPALPIGMPISIQFGLHSGMGPGGLLWRWSDDDAWSSMAGASAWGAERLPWPRDWRIGAAHAPNIVWHHQSFDFCDCF